MHPLHANLLLPTPVLQNLQTGPPLMGMAGPTRLSHGRRLTPFTRQKSVEAADRREDKPMTGQQRDQREIGQRALPSCP